MPNTGCPCGTVRFDVAFDVATTPGRMDVCLGTGCRAQASSAFGVPGIVPPDAVWPTVGQPRLWSRRTQTGKTLARADCGRWIEHRNAPHSPEVSINGSAQNPYVDLTAAPLISTDSTLPGVMIPPDSAPFPQDHA